MGARTPHRITKQYKNSFVKIRFIKENYKTNEINLYLSINTRMCNCHIYIYIHQTLFWSFSNGIVLLIVLETTMLSVNERIQYDSSSHRQRTHSTLTFSQDNIVSFISLFVPKDLCPCSAYILY